MPEMTDTSSLPALAHRPKWLWFDLDDTLWDFKSNSDTALRQLYDASDVLRSQFDCFEAFSDLYHEVNHELWGLYAEAKITADYLKSERFRRVLGLADNPVSSGLCAALNREYLRLLTLQTRLVDGAEEVLAKLSRLYMIGVLSNGFADTQYHKLYRTPLWRYVQRMVISDEIDCRKPHTRIFRHAERAVGAAPRECLMIGDNPDTDIAGARAAGWQALWLDPAGCGDISSLRQLLPLLCF